MTARLADHQPPTGTPAAGILEWLRSGSARTDPPPRIAAVLAHPDDESIGLGSRLPLLRAATLIYITDGAPADGRDAAAHGFRTVGEYALARRRERQHALALAGIAPERIIDLDVADQTASLDLADLARRIALALDAAKPDAVITHPYEGGHPDHDAAAFATHAACRLLRRAGCWRGSVLEFTSYHRGPSGIRVGAFLPAPGAQTVTVALTDEQRRFKADLLRCYPTQTETLGRFPLDTERFRAAPTYDFTRPPHDGPLYYEQFPWGMTGPRFRSLAAAALAALDLEGGG